MATELAAGYVSLTVKLAQGGMADLNKEVKKAGTEGGTAYSDEFNKQIGKASKGGGLKKAAKEAAEQFGNGFREGIDQELARGGGSDGITDVVAKAVKKGGALKKTAQEAAKEFGEGFNEGVKQAIEGHGEIASSLDVISDKVKDTTKTIQDLGKGIGIDTGPVTTASKAITDALDGVSSSVSNTRAALDSFKSGDVSGGLQATVNAFKGLENIGVPKGVAESLQNATNTAADVRTQVNGVLGPLEQLTELAGPDSKIFKAGKKLPIIGDFVELGVAAREAGQDMEAALKKATGHDIPLSLESIIKRQFEIAGDFGTSAQEAAEAALNAAREYAAANPITLGTKLGEPTTEDFDSLFGKGLKVPLIPDDTQIQGWFAKMIGNAPVLPVTIKPANGPPIGPGAAGPAGLPVPRDPYALSTKPGQRAAGDNMVRGPGGVDNVLSWLTAGEGVVKKSAMQGGGAAIVAALNAGRRIPGFQAGSNEIPLPASAKADESNLQYYSVLVARSIAAMFPQIKQIGGWRATDEYPWHPSGRAVDIMIPGWDTPGGKALGDQIHAYLSANKAAFGIESMLWQTMTGGNHFNHIHVQTKDTGGPAGAGATYSLSSSSPGGGGGGSPFGSPGGGGGTGGGTGGGAGGSLSDNPYKALQQINQQRQQLDNQTGEQVKKIMPDMGALADIGVGGLKETFLPPGFSDPTQWKSTKSVGALLSFIGNISGDPTAKGILGGIGAGITGSGSGAYSSIMGAIPQPFGTRPQQQQPAVGDFPAAAHGVSAGAPPGPGQAPVPGALPGQTGPQIVVENMNTPADKAMATAASLNNFNTAAQKQDAIRR